MKKIVEEVLEAEKKLDTILRQARQKASEIRLTAEKEMSEQTNNARQQARELTQAAVEDAKQQAQRDRQERLEQADKAKDVIIQENADKINSLVDSICDIVLSTEYGRDSN
ncbi:MAG: hypothetical protein ACYSWP_07540 [Planctomycetota bacterium]|jgi:vacuolar-type H+-ATPase subunit H